MQTERISTNLNFVLLIFCLFFLGTIAPIDPLLAQKNCVNQMFGQLYLDSNNNEIPEPDETAVPGPVSITAKQTLKEIIYDATDGSFQTGDIICDKYKVTYNGFTIGTFEIGEVMGPIIHYFSTTPAICASEMSGHLYLDSNGNDTREPDEAKVSGPVSIIAAQTLEETVHGAANGSFETEMLVCGRYNAKYNGVTIGTFEIDEFGGPITHNFAITEEIMVASDTPPGAGGTAIGQEFRLYLPLITK